MGLKNNSKALYYMKKIEVKRMASARNVARNLQFKNLLHSLLLQYSLDYDPKHFNEEDFLKNNSVLIKQIQTLLKDCGDHIQYQQIIQDFSGRFDPFPHKYIFKWIKKPDIPNHKQVEESKVFEDFMIYHYTSESMLDIFLKNDASFSVTHWNFLNDSNELFAYFRKFNLKETEPYDVPFFLMSFSRSADDLNLWRAYAHNGGYAIGFSFSELENAFVDSILLRECVYSSNDDIVGDVPYKNVFCFYKDPAFSSELEVRLLFECPKDQTERIEIIGNKPRIKLNLSNKKTISSFIKEIIVSPSGNIDYNLNMAKMLCHIHKITPKITLSKIPFRDW